MAPWTSPEPELRRSPCGYERPRACLPGGPVLVTRCLEQTDPREGSSQVMPVAPLGRARGSSWPDPRAWSTASGFCERVCLGGLDGRGWTGGPGLSRALCAHWWPAQTHCPAPGLSCSWASSGRWASSWSLRASGQSSSLGSHGVTNVVCWQKLLGAHRGESELCASRRVAQPSHCLLHQVGAATEAPEPKACPGPRAHLDLGCVVSDDIAHGLS